ncbi:MAG: S8 family serine peptidase [Thermoplasmatota archaeon]
MSRFSDSRTVPRKTGALVMISILLVPAILALVPRGPELYPGFEGVIDPYLRGILSGGEEDEMGVLVQFKGHPIDDDIRYAESIGLQLITTMKVLPAALFRGGKEDFERLSGYPRVEWMEYDGGMELMMEESLTTINATVAWNSWIESARDRYPRITGEGITVAVVDTGIDAGHPDLDYEEKTIINIKSDIPGGPWYSIENSDTSYGHGTHCAGTIAGNGDASAGARAGVAPDAKLIGLCVGDVGITLTNTLQGLEWVYENSKKPNRYNIKVVSNSWGGGAAEYNPEDATSKICQKLTYENNVVVVFAMGNAGRGHHQAEDLTASPTGLIPSNIGVAAFEREGSGVADFSSRGKRGLNQTYPDVGAPGVRIWSAHARITTISGMSVMAGNDNPYYLAISGTSMATPHVSGLAALMFQAAPSLTISNRWEDYSGPDSEWWYDYQFNRIHEVEWIMEQSATYLRWDGIPLTNEQEDNGVPEPEDRSETEIGWDGKPIDWAQGYGLVNAEKCVGIALTLQELRERYSYKKWTVRDAIEVYNGRRIFHDSSRNLSTDTLTAAWDAEFARYSQDGRNIFLIQNQSRLIWVPEGASEIAVSLQYDPIQLEDRTFGELTFVVDYGFDGDFDYQEDFFGSRTSGTKYHVFTDLSGKTNMYWAIGVFGRGFKLIRPFQDGEYMEMRVPYSLSVNMKLQLPQDTPLSFRPPRPNSMVAYWEEGQPSQDYSGGTLIIHGTAFDLDRVVPYPEVETGGGEQRTPWGWVLAVIIVAAAAFASWVVWKKRRTKPEP